MSLFRNSVNAVAGISRSVPTGGFFVGKSRLSFPFMSELLLGEKEDSLTALPVLAVSSPAAKWFAFQQWETTLYYDSVKFNLL